MKYIKLFEDLESYEKEFVFKEGYYWLISNYKTLIEFTLLIESELDKQAMHNILENIRMNGITKFFGMFIYKDVYPQYVIFNNEREKKEQIDVLTGTRNSIFTDSYNFIYDGEIKVKDRWKIVVDTLENDISKYNL